MPSRNLTRTALIAASLLAVAGCAYEVEPGASDDALVVTDRENPVSSFTRVTVAPGIGPSVGSETTPRI